MKYVNIGFAPVYCNPTMVVVEPGYSVKYDDAADFLRKVLAPTGYGFGIHLDVEERAILEKILASDTSTKSFDFKEHEKKLKKMNKPAPAKDKIEPSDAMIPDDIPGGKIFNKEHEKTDESKEDTGQKPHVMSIDDLLSQNNEKKEDRPVEKQPKSSRKRGKRDK